jgi:hypothetical protein
MNLLEKLSNAITFSEYLHLIDQLHAEHKVTGPNQDEALLAYSMLNRKRMERLEKTIRLLPEIESQVQEINTPMVWLTITEGWCGDAAQIVPIIDALAKANPMIEHKIILRDEHTDIIDQFLTNGGRAIPITVFIDAQTGKVMGHWGPRPRGAQEIMDQYKINIQVPGTDADQKAKLFEDAKTQLHTWYAHNKTVDVQNEFCQKVQEGLNILVK